MLNLNKFVEENEFIVPIVEGWGKVNSRKIWKNVKDGWYKVKIGNLVKVIAPATSLEIYKTLREKKSLRVYVLGEEGIPVNFDNFEKRGFGNSVRVHFLSLPLFEVASIVLWEDGRFYAYQADVVYERSMLKSMKTLFEQGKSINGLKGITPELFYYFLLIFLQNQAYKEAEAIKRMKLDDEEKKKRLEQFKNSLDERLKKAIEDAGGKFIRFSKANANTYLVTWKVGNQIVKSTINDRFQILNAGYCLSGSDKDHSVSSLVALAKMFRKDAPLYITRE